tara:strand:- start:98 stop:304 length:207 start_codon:yes stop_codon:yes gene_type:complete
MAGSVCIQVDEQEKRRKHDGGGEHPAVHATLSTELLAKASQEGIHLAQLEKKPTEVFLSLSPYLTSLL